MSEKIRPPETASSHSRDAENSMTGQGQQIMVVALGEPTPASNRVGTFFPVARLVKIIASHS